MKLGLSTYALTWAFGIAGYELSSKLTICDFLDKAATLGFQGVQIADNAPLSNFSPEERQQVWQQAKELGLFVEIGARGLTDDNLKRHIEIADEAESPFLRFVIDGPGFEPTFEELPEILGAGADQCGEKGIILAIENHDRFEAHQFASWFEAIDSPWLGLCLDTANSYGCGEGFRETIDTLLPYTVNFHLKDFKVRRQPHMLGFLLEGTPAGEGLLPIPDILKRLENNGRCDRVTLEHWPAFQGTVDATVKMEEEWCALSMNNLKRYFPDLR